MTPARRGPIDAGEAMALLQQNAEYQDAKAAVDRQRAQRERFWSKAEQPLVKDLRAAGFHVDSVWDLVNSTYDYPGAVPVLVKHLQEDYPDRVREGIARALAVPFAADVWPTLRTQYLRQDVGPDTRMGLAAALAATMTPERVDEAVELLRDQDRGESRLLMVRGLRRLRTSRAREVLRHIADDEGFPDEVRALARGRAKS